MTKMIKNLVSITLIFSCLSLICLGLTQVETVYSSKMAKKGSEGVLQGQSEESMLLKNAADFSGKLARPLNDKEKARKFREMMKENKVKVTKEGKRTLKELHLCQSVVYDTLNQLPEEQVNHLKKLTLVFDPEARRGLGGGDTIKIRCSNVIDKELTAVLIHEIGHVVDTGLITGSRAAGDSGWRDGFITLYNNDFSLGYYQISWANERELQNEFSELDFVSGYATTDPFEDFAESYLYYRLHGPDFRYLAFFNDALASKYQFLKKEIFEGQEFGLNETVSEELQVTTRPYDATKLTYDYRNFLTQ